MKDFKYGPRPIPTLTGKDAEEFERQNARPLTKKQKARLKEASKVYEAIQKNSVKGKKLRCYGETIITNDGKHWEYDEANQTWRLLET